MNQSWNSHLPDTCIINSCVANPYNMALPSDDEIRHRILVILHIHAQENPESLGLDRETMKTLMGIPEKTLFFNMKYLAEKGLIQLARGIGIWFHAQITAFGIDVAENREKFGEQFPFVQTTIQEIHGDVYGSAILAVQSEVSLSGQVTAAFKEARAMADKKNDLPGDLKEEINRYLDLLEEELKKKEPDAGKIQRAWRWLKKNANWLVPILTQIILEGMKNALGS